MASGFKTATVNASDVPATQTNFPAYVDLSRIGITTLAEAQSVRVYADSAKTTEWAREIVSVSEMHVKIPSLTSSTVIYVDWDGVRADYAVTDTYGRNAVWSDWAVVMHFENNVTDSTGNITPTALNGPTYSTGQIGNGIVGNGTNQYVSLGDIRSLFSGDNAYATALVKLDTATPSASAQTGLWGINNASGGAQNTHYPFTDGNIYDGTFNTSRPGFSPSGAVTRTNWHKVSVTTESGANNWDFWQNTTIVHSQTGLATAGIGSISRIMASKQSTPPDHYLDGMMDEFRLANFTPDSNWITTELNNHLDEAGFWGTWSNVSAGATDNAIFAFGGF